MLLIVGLAGTAAAAPSRLGSFRTTCDFSHRSSDDPIVMPGMRGAAHSHDFFGSASTNALSTYPAMVRSATTCDRPGDTSGYWVPTIYDHGRPVLPTHATIYYRNGAPVQSSIRAMPANFRMVAGDAHATDAPNPRIVGWSCQHRDGRKSGWVSAVPTCPVGQPLVFRVRFQDCWNGTSLDSPTHNTHVSYRLPNDVCPQGFPVSIPQIALEVILPSTRGGPSVTLASGRVATGHGDFWNTWNQAGLNSLVVGCLAAARQCNTGS